MREDRAERGANTFAVPWLLCIGLSGVSATLLHFAPDRASAAWIVLPAVAWAALIMVPVIGLANLRWWAFLLVALSVRAPLWGTPSHLSDDVARYVWEGSLLTYGVDPWIYAPSQVHVEGWEAARAAVNHPTVPSAYPPGAALWFVLVAPGGPLGAQVAASFADLAVVLALLRSGARQGAWWYALHPLAALESASGAHLEAPALALAAWSWTWTRGGPALALLSASVKILPVLALPSLVRRSGWAGVLGAGALAAGLGAILLPWVTVDHLNGLGRYAQHWSFNGLLYPWLTQAVSPETARLALAVLGACGVLVAATYRDVRVSFLIVAVSFVCITPTMHPWYALWVLAPAAALERRAWVLASAAPVLSYGVLASWEPETGGWTEAPWLWWATWGAVAAAFAGGWSHSRRPSNPT